MLFIEDGAPVIVQGMTGHQGMTHTARMLKAGTNIVGGVNPRKAGTSVTFPGAKNGADADIPVFATCGEAREATGAKASVVFVPPKFAKSAVVEAVEAGIELIVVITEGIPVACLPHRRRAFWARQAGRRCQMVGRDPCYPGVFHRPPFDACRGPRTFGVRAVACGKAEIQNGLFRGKRPVGHRRHHAVSHRDRS